MTLLRQMNFKKILVVFFLFFCSFSLMRTIEVSHILNFTFLNVEDGVEVKVTGTIKQGIFRLLKPETKYRSYPEFINYLQNSIDLGDQCKIQSQ